MNPKTTWYAALFASLALSAVPAYAAKAKPGEIKGAMSKDTSKKKKIVTKIAEAPNHEVAPISHSAPKFVFKTLQLAKVEAPEKMVEGLVADDYAERTIREGSRENVVYAAKNPAKAQTMVWMHGAGQRPSNIIIRRLIRALNAQGVDLQIHSMEYETKTGMDDILKFIGEQKSPVLIGGHSAGSGLAEYIAARYPKNVKAAILLNLADGHDSQVPTLQLHGSADEVGGNRAGSPNPLVKAVLIQHSDHSLRYAPYGSHSPEEKDNNNRSVNTWELNKLVASEIKAFLKGL